MIKPDDSSLDPGDLRAVEERSRRLLDRADAWNKYPIPIADILAAAKVQVAPTSAFDRRALLSYVNDKATRTGALIKSAIAKVLALYDAGEKLIHVDGSVVLAKQTFLKLHEIAHHEMPTHRKLFRFFQDCRKTLAPEITDQFEREANNFARFAIFKGNTFSDHAADCELGIKTPIGLAKKFGASIYASIREYARTNHSACVVYVLNPVETDGFGDNAMWASVRRIEASPSFITQFGLPNDTTITPDHFLWPVLPIGCRMTRPVLIPFLDRNNVPHECVAEAFDTTYNILVLIFTMKAMTSKTITLDSSWNSV